jgi:hypothetical protein
MSYDHGEAHHKESHRSWHGVSTDCVLLCVLVFYLSRGSDLRFQARGRSTRNGWYIGHVVVKCLKNGKLASTIPSLPLNTSC